MCPTQQVLAETSCWSELFPLFTRGARVRGCGEGNTQGRKRSSKCHQLRPRVYNKLNWEPWPGTPVRSVLTVAGFAVGQEA